MIQIMYHIYNKLTLRNIGIRRHVDTQDFFIGNWQILVHDLLG